MCEPRQLLGQLIASHLRAAHFSCVDLWSRAEDVLGRAASGSRHVVVAAQGPARTLLEADRPDLSLLVLAEDGRTEAVAALVRRGARGVYLTSSSPHELVSAVQALGAGERWLPPGTAYAVVAVLARGQGTRDARQAALSAREREILNHLAHGRNVTEIAAQLKLSRRTVQTHLRNAQRKLAVHSQVEAAAFARQTLS